MQPYEQGYRFPSSGVGLDAVIANLVDRFSSITWLEEVYGRTYQHTKGDEVLPRCLSRSGQYITLTPNTFKNAFCFFYPSDKSEIEFERIKHSGRNLLIERDMAAVVWFDCRKLGYKDQMPYDTLQEDCLKALVASTDVQSISGCVEDDISEVFSGFNLSEDYYQFIMWPYGAFKIDFRVGYRTSC